METSDPLLVWAPSALKSLLVFVINQVAAQVTVTTTSLWRLEKKAKEIAAYQISASAPPPSPNRWTEDVFLQQLPLKSSMLLSPDENNEILALVNRKIKSAVLPSLHEKIQTLEATIKPDQVKRFIEEQVEDNHDLDGLLDETIRSALRSMNSDETRRWILNYAKSQAVLVDLNSFASAVSPAA
jgi:hypothetical protein